MLQIEEALHAVHAEALAEREKKKKEAAQAAALQGESSSSTTAQTSQSGSGSNTVEALLTPFAKVNAVAPDSPAREAVRFFFFSILRRCDPIFLSISFCHQIKD